MSKTYGAEDFAKAAGVEVATARVIFRKLKVKKKGKNYELSKTEHDALVKKHKDGAKEAPKKAVKKAKKKVAKKEAAE